ncbi:hypothetical protein AB0M02_38395 [Actinoplanes sp. NPDC051861]|uniref:hypothetical protein n=1 Tax=Actinoplanes sp. NPDC051861 TaxID=3155170 RepID=UPI00342837DE
MPRLRERFLADGLPVIDSPLLETLTREIYDDVLDLYSVAATARVAERERATAARNRLRATGLRSIFGRDVTAVRLVAAMSLVGDRLAMITPDLAGDTYGQLMLAKLYFLPDEDDASLRACLDGVVARDADSLVLAQLEDRLVIFA